MLAYLFVERRRDALRHLEQLVVYGHAGCNLAQVDERVAPHAWHVGVYLGEDDARIFNCRLGGADLHAIAAITMLIGRRQRNQGYIQWDVAFAEELWNFIQEDRGEVCLPGLYGITHIAADEK